MGHPRPRPVAEASPFDAALEIAAPLLEQLEALEAIRTVLVSAIRMKAELPKLQAEYAALAAAVPRLRTKQNELQAAIARTMDQVMALERSGVVVKLPSSITGARS
jgi:cell division protein ZapA (FtsZ GTPase activity inhibitor)